MVELFKYEDRAMKKILMFLGVGVLCVVGLTGCPQYQDDPYFNGYYCEFTVNNNSDYVISELYFYSYATQSWSYDELPYLIYPGEAYTVYKHQGYYSLFARSTGGTEWSRDSVDLYYDYYDWYLWNKGSKGEATSNKGLFKSPLVGE